MNQHTTYNPTTISPPANMIQPIVPPPQYIPIQQDTFINTSASIPEAMKLFDGLDHSFTPEEYLQQVEARLTFAIGEEPQNNPIKIDHGIIDAWHIYNVLYLEQLLIGTLISIYHINNNGIHLYNCLKNDSQLKKQLIMHK